MSTTTWNSDLLSKGSIFRMTRPMAGKAKDTAISTATPARQQAPVAPAATLVEQRREHPLEQAVQPGGELAAAMVAAARRRLHPQARQPGCDAERDAQRQQHAHAGVDRDGAHVRPGQAGEEGHRQQGRDHRQRGQHGRAAHLVHRARGSAATASFRDGAAAAGGCSPPRRWRRPPGCRWRRSGRTATPG